MAVDSGALKQWAKGRSTKSVDSDEEDKSPDHPGDDDGGDSEHDDDEEDPGERNALWAGEEQGDLEEVVTPEMADEMLSWLEDNEPDIHDAVMSLGEAVVGDDPDAVDEAKSELGWAEQHLNPAYSELTEEQRDKAGDYIAQCLDDKDHPAKGSPEFQQAVAIGLAKARHEDGGGDEKSKPHGGQHPEQQPSPDKSKPKGGGGSPFGGKGGGNPFGGGKGQN